MPSPRVSIGMPVYNGAEYLEEAIESILAQDFVDLELIISDNGSDDGTEAIARRHALLDSRVRYFRFEANEGAARNYNRVFELSGGEYFKWAAHDDICRPRFLSSCVDALDRASPSVVLAYPGSRFIDAEGNEVGDDTDRMGVTGPSARFRLGRCLATLNMAAPVFGLIRSEALRRTRLIDRFVASDYVLITELALLGEFHEVREPLFLRRVHGRSSRAANRTDDEVLRWFDPAARRKGLLSVRQRLMIEYMRSIGRLVGPLPTRMTCLATVPLGMAVRRARVAGGLWKQQLLARLTGATAEVPA